MPDHIFVSNYPESDVDQDADMPLDDARFAYYHELLPPNPIVLAERMERLPGADLTAAVLYAGIRYEAGAGLERGIWWAGWSGTKRQFREAIRRATAGRPAILTSRREVQEAITIATLLMPTIASKEPSNIVAWSFRLPG